MTEAVKKPLPETVEKLLTETTNDKELVKQLDKTLGNWGYLMEKVFKKCINRIIDKNSNTLKTGGKKGKKGKKSDSKKGGLDRNIVFAVVLIIMFIKPIINVLQRVLSPGTAIDVFMEGFNEARRNKGGTKNGKTSSNNNDDESAIEMFIDSTNNGPDTTNQDEIKARIRELGNYINENEKQMQPLVVQLGDLTSEAINENTLETGLMNSAFLFLSIVNAFFLTGKNFLQSETVQGIFQLGRVAGNPVDELVGKPAEEGRDTVLRNLGWFAGKMYRLMAGDIPSEESPRPLGVDEAMNNTVVYNNLIYFNNLENRLTELWNGTIEERNVPALLIITVGSYLLLQTYLVPYLNHTNRKKESMNIINDQLTLLRDQTNGYITQRREEYAQLNIENENLLKVFIVMNQLHPPMQPPNAPPMPQPPMQPPNATPNAPPMPQPSNMNFPRLMRSSWPLFNNPNKNKNKGDKSKENKGGKSKKNKGGKSKKNKSKKNKGGKSKKNKTKKN